MDYEKLRFKMVEQQLKARSIKDPSVIRAMLKVPRHLFVDEALRDRAYGDYPLPIGENQTISQPYMVAFMTQLLQLKGNEKILEIGTGSGYQAAILAELSAHVVSIERFKSLAQKARKVLDQLKYFHIAVKVGDGSFGCKEESPFDAIVITAGAPQIAEVLTGQLKPGGRMVIPVGDADAQHLILIEKDDSGHLEQINLGYCRFVKLVGEQAWQESS